MTRRISLVSLLAIVFFEIQSQTIARDGFDEAVGTLPVTLHNYDGGGDGWGSNWITQNGNTSGFVIEDLNPLVHPEVPNPGPYCHSAGTFFVTGRYFDAFGDFSDFAVYENGPIGVGTLYFSFLIRKEVDNDNEVELIFSDVVGEPWQTPDQLIEVGYLGDPRSNGAGGIRYWSLAAMGGGVDQSDSVIVIGRTYKIVVEVAFGSTTTINMWVNPENGIPDQLTPDASVSSTADLSFWNVALFFNNTAASFDEFIFSEDFSTALPVEFGEFFAQVKRDVVELKWSTVTEISNDHFLVERSAGGKQWSPIGSVQGNGDSNEVINYEFVDNNPSPGLNYYRLKQVDYDGASDISKIVSIDYSVDLEKEIIIYKKSEKLKFLSRNQIDELLIFDLKGTLVAHHYPNDNTYSLDLTKNETVFIAVIRSGTEVWSQRVFID